MHILEKAGGPSTNTQEIIAEFKVAIADGMAEVQSLDKPEWIKNCRDLAEHFTNRLLVKFNDYSRHNCQAEAPCTSKYPSSNLPFTDISLHALRSPCLGPGISV